MSRNKDKRLKVLNKRKRMSRLSKLEINECKYNEVYTKQNYKRKL